jgi:RNA polymerase sigma-70 factor (ECF subfamily)
MVPGDRHGRIDLPVAHPGSERDLSTPSSEETNRPAGTGGAPGPAPGEPADAELVEQASQGKAGALRQLYRRFSSTAYALAVRISRSPADADEILVDSFHQVWKQADHYDPSRGTVAGWILNIVRSRALDRMRRRLRTVRLKERMSEPGALPLPRPPDPEDEAVRSQQRDRLHDAMETLPEDQRRVIDLSYFQGLSQSEIAERLGQPLGTIKTRMRLAMTKLRRTLAESR